ncbi:hypothetical protein AAKU55_002698 [Oxalobacteraceae bacterium GrIS 1.11]
MENNHRFGRRAWAAALLLGAAGAAPAAPVKGMPRYGVSVYSDLCLQEQNGDFGGQRISLHRFSEGDTVLYEFTAGALSWPLVATEVNLDSKTGAFDFTVAGADNEERTISGKFSPDGQTLTLVGAYCGGVGLPMRLTRVSDFGRKLTACKPCPAPSGAPPDAPPDAAPDSTPYGGSART